MCCNRPCQGELNSPPDAVVGLLELSHSLQDRSGRVAAVTVCGVTTHEGTRHHVMCCGHPIIGPSLDTCQMACSSALSGYGGEVCTAGLPCPLTNSGDSMPSLHNLSACCLTGRLRADGPGAREPHCAVKGGRPPPHSQHKYHMMSRPVSYDVVSYDVSYVNSII
jgi:hypothetical protein